MTIATNKQVEEMLEVASTSQWDYSTIDYGPVAMDCIATSRGYESFVHRVHKTCWVEMGHQYSVMGQYQIINEEEL